MTIVDELRTKTWPTRPEKVRLGSHSAGCFVREGHVETRALQMHQNLSEPIPAGECAITSLCHAGNGLIYGATSGKRSHLFRYDPGPGQDSVVDLGVLPGAREVRRSLAALGDGHVLGGVTTMDNPAEGGYLFLYPPREQKPGVVIERLTVPVEGEGIATLVVDKARKCAYGLSATCGTLFRYDVNEGAVSLKGAVDETGAFSQTLVLGTDGNVYGAKALGELFRYDPKTDVVSSLGIHIPSVAGRQLYNRLDSAVLDEHTGLIYGGGSADGVVFQFDPRAGHMVALGKVTAEPRVRCMTVGLDGRIYGIAGEQDGMGHLFRFDPETRELADLGIPYSGMDRVWHGYEFDAACTGEFGEIYLGESDRISHLFLYFPPVKRRAQVAAR